MTPTLSQVRNWDTEHLAAAASHWTSTATIWEDCFTEYATQVRAPGGVTWEGQAAEAAQQRAHSDRMVVIGLADQLHDAAMIARAGAIRIAEANRLVLRSVDAAERAGFTVAEDFSVKDHRAYPRAVAAVRRARAENFAADLRTTIADLVIAEEQVAAQLTTATAGLILPESSSYPAGSAPAATGASPR